MDAVCDAGGHRGGGVRAAAVVDPRAAPAGAGPGGVAAVPVPAGAHRSVRAHPDRLRTRRPRPQSGRHPARLVRPQSRVSRAHVQPFRAVHAPHRLGGRATRHAAGARAAAGHRERLRALRLLQRPRHGPVAVHPGHRHAFRHAAELVVRRPPRRARIDPCGARLPAVPARRVRRRLAAGDRRLQLRRGLRRPRGPREPRGRPADRFLEPAPAERDACLRAEAPGDEAAGADARDLRHRLQCDPQRALLRPRRHRQPDRLEARRRARRAAARGAVRAQPGVPPLGDAAARSAPPAAAPRGRGPVPPEPRAADARRAHAGRAPRRQARRDAGDDRPPLRLPAADDPDAQ